MNNDPELDPKYLGKISSDFVKVSDFLKEASYQMRTRKISDYPIFPVSKDDLPIGGRLYEMGQMGNEWHYHISFLEEFLQRELIENEEDFKAVFKDPDEYCCLFIVEEKFTNLVFIPFPID